MQVFLQIVAFSLQNDGSGRPVLTKGKRIKIHSLGFSKYFLLWMIDYLTHWRQLVQIDDRKSDTATVELGVPQGSILGPVIFNLFVADLWSELQCDCYQYADDMTFYIHSKPCDLNSSADHINKALTSLRDYSKCGNLTLNSSKANWMLISTPRMARYRSSEERKLPVACGDTRLKRISCTKLLGVYLDQHLAWKTHVDHVLSSSYGTLPILRRLKNLAPFHVRKNLAESLVLSKVNYAYFVFHPLPAFQVKGLQRLQNAFAGCSNVHRLPHCCTGVCILFLLVLGSPRQHGRQFPDICCKCGIVDLCHP